MQTGDKIYLRSDCPQREIIFFVSGSNFGVFYEQVIGIHFEVELFENAAQGLVKRGSSSLAVMSRSNRGLR